MIDIDRPAASPDVLAELARGQYAGRAICRQLAEMFFAKCYICESRVLRADMEVDHLRPKSKMPTERLEWTNLFPACRHCNGRKGASTSWEIGPGDGVEHRIMQTLRNATDPCLPAVNFAAVDEEDAPAVRLAAELRRLHCPTGSSAPEKTEDLLETIGSHFADRVFPAIHAVRVARRGRAWDIADAERRLRDLLGPAGPYSMLMRSLIPSDLTDLVPLARTPSSLPDMAYSE